MEGLETEDVTAETIAKKNNSQNSDEQIRRKELPYAFELEIINKQNKRIYIVEDYIPLDSYQPIAGKFHTSQNGGLSVGRKFVSFVECAYKIPVEKYEYPVLASHSYGWKPRSICQDKLAILNQIIAPKRRSAMTEFGEKVVCSRITERPSFNGIRFYLR